MSITVISIEEYLCSLPDARNRIYDVVVPGLSPRHCTMRQYARRVAEAIINHGQILALSRARQEEDAVSTLCRFTPETCRMGANIGFESDSMCRNEVLVSKFVRQEVERQEMEGITDTQAVLLSEAMRNGTIDQMPYFATLKEIAPEERVAVIAMRTNKTYHWDGILKYGISKAKIIDDLRCEFANCETLDTRIESLRALLGLVSDSCGSDNSDGVRADKYLSLIGAIERYPHIEWARIASIVSLSRCRKFCP